MTTSFGIDYIPSTLTIKMNFIAQPLLGKSFQLLYEIIILIPLRLKGSINDTRFSVKMLIPYILMH